MEKFGANFDDPHFRIVATQASPAVVGLSSYSGEKLLFACSGTIIQDKSLPSGHAFIITSATLVRRDPLVDTIAHDLKVVVHKIGGAKLQGHLQGIDWHYNIAIVAIYLDQPSTTTTTKGLSLGTRVVRAKERVVALGRHYSSGGIMGACGAVAISSFHKFDCQELMFSSTKITKCGIGGPLLDEQGNWIGLNFFDKDEIPFLPGLVIMKCFKQLKSFGYVRHPCLGVHLRPMDALSLSKVERIFQRTGVTYGLLVDRVVEGSGGCLSGLRRGDVILKVGDTPLLHVAELAGLLLHLSEEAHGAEESSNLGQMILNEVLVQKNRGPSTHLSISLEDLRYDHFNRWPVREVPIFQRDSSYRYLL